VIVLSEFLDESKDHLEGIEDKVLKLEVSKDPDLVNSIFRPIHTVKGSSSFLGLTQVSELSHELETLLDDIRKERITEISSAIIDVLLEAIDLLSRMLNNIRAALETLDDSEEEMDTDIPDVDYGDIIQRIISLRAGAAETGGQVTPGQDAGTQTGAAAPTPSPGDDAALKITYPGDMKLQYEVESAEQLGAVEKTMLALENAPLDFGLYNTLFRALHSIKGNTGVILSVIDNEHLRKNHFLNQFKEIAHLAESIVQRKRDSKQPLREEEIELLLSSTDCMKNFLDAFKKNAHPLTPGCPALRGETCDRHIPSSEGAGAAAETGVCPLLTDLEAVASNVLQDIISPAGGIKDIGGDSLAEAVSNNLAQNIEAAEQGLDEIGQPEKRSTALRKLKRGYKNMVKIAKRIDHPFLLEKADGALKLVNFMLTEKNAEEEIFIENLRRELLELKEKADRRKDKELVDRRKATIPPPTTDITRDMEARISDKVLKVSQEKIDVFMNLIGELLVSKNSLNAFEREVSTHYDLPEIAHRLKEAADTIARISNDLQTNIMDIRMLPVANAFSRFPRMIRDLSKKLNKKMKLEISGEETEIDKTIIEALADPLVHMVRNSADHGIEAPDERAAQGKPAEGVVRLEAFNQGQYVVIRISDDGRGMNPGRIRQKALERALAPPEELETMDEQQVFGLIFLPGFSMAQEVSDVSGRGVGMDVVKTNIEKLGGEVQVDSSPGKGSVFTIKLPLTMAIGRGLEVEAGKNRYYVPLESITETLRVPSEKLFQYKGREMTVIRDELIPVYRLAHQLGLKTNGDARAAREALVILNVKGQKLGMVVDNYYNESEYVIKPLSGGISNIEGISGAMITGEGRVHLILDLMRLF
jgi:two-component system chemotaxis sensor kinase CheA